MGKESFIISDLLAYQRHVFNIYRISFMALSPFIQKNIYVTHKKREGGWGIEILD